MMMIVRHYHHQQQQQQQQTSVTITSATQLTSPATSLKVPTFSIEIKRLFFYHPKPLKNLLVGGELRGLSWHQVIREEVLRRSYRLAPLPLLL
jgi:hypothetical protein